MLMYSCLHPTHQGVLQICHIKEVLKLPVMVIFSIIRRNVEEKRHLTHLAHCGIKVIQLPPRLSIAKPPEVNIVYFAEEGYDDTGKVLEYQFKAAIAAWLSMEHKHWL